MKKTICSIFIVLIIGWIVYGTDDWIIAAAGLIAPHSPISALVLEQFAWLIGIVAAIVAITFLGVLGGLTAEATAAGKVFKAILSPLRRLPRFLYGLMAAAVLLYVLLTILGISVTMPAVVTTAAGPLHMGSLTLAIATILVLVGLIAFALSRRASYVIFVAAALVVGYGLIRQLPHVDEIKQAAATRGEALLLRIANRQAMSATADAKQAVAADKRVIAIVQNRTECVDDAANFVTTLVTNDKVRVTKEIVPPAVVAHYGDAGSVKVQLENADGRFRGNSRYCWVDGVDVIRHHEEQVLANNPNVPWTETKHVDPHAIGPFHGGDEDEDLKTIIIGHCCQRQQQGKGSVQDCPGQMAPPTCGEQFWYLGGDKGCDYTLIHFPKG